MRLESALLEPCTRVRLQAQAVFQDDLPSRGWSRAEDPEDYVQSDQLGALSTGDSAQATRQLRIIRRCAVPCKSHRPDGVFDRVGIKLNRPLSRNLVASDSNA